MENADAESHVAERTAGSQVPAERVTARAFAVPTDAPEADGTLSWDSTTVVLVQASAGGHTGLGYSYAAGAAAPLVRELLLDVVRYEH